MLRNLSFGSLGNTLGSFDLSAFGKISHIARVEKLFEKVRVRNQTLLDGHFKLVKRIANVGRHAPGVRLAMSNEFQGKIRSETEVSSGGNHQALACSKADFRTTKVMRPAKIALALQSLPLLLRHPATRNRPPLSGFRRARHPLATARNHRLTH